MSSSSAGTVKDSETVLPVPVSSRDCAAALSPRVALRLQPAEGEHAANDIAEVLGRLIVAGLGAEGAGQPAVDMACRGEPLHRADLVGNLFGELRLAGQHVEPADGPRVVGPLDVADELHHLVVAGDAVRAHLGVDGALDGGALADGDEAGLEERDGHAWAW